MRGLRAILRLQPFISHWTESDERVTQLSEWGRERHLLPEVERDALPPSSAAGNIATERDE